MILGFWSNFFAGDGLLLLLSLCLATSIMLLVLWAEGGDE